MKISELKRIAKENDYEYEPRFMRTRFKRKYDGYTNEMVVNEYAANYVWFSNYYHCDEKDFNMIKATMKYAETPPDDREEEKKFYLRHKFLSSSMEGISYYGSFVNYNIRDKGIYLADRGEIGDIKTNFTLKEIEEIKEEFGTDLSDFELVEVQE